MLYSDIVHVIEETKALSPQEWDKFVAGSQWGHILQTHRWGQLKEKFGWEARHLALVRERNIVGVAQLLLRKLPLGRTVAYIPRGPVLPPDQQERAHLLLNRAIALARQHHAILLKVEPGWSERDNIPAMWQELGMRKGAAVQPRNTILLDLAGTEDEWLQRMKSKTRYNIRLAGRKGVQIREGSLDDLPAFHELMVTTGARDGFAVRSQSYYQEAWKLFASANMATLLFATFEGELLAGIMPFACGETAWYMYGGSSNRHRNKMPNYALQWAAMRWAKAQGCKTYDLWGIPDEAGESQDNLPQRGSLWGVYRFKKGFGGYLHRTVGGYDAILSAPLYWAYQQVQTWRHRRRTTR